MDPQSLVRASQILKPKDFQLKDHDPRDTGSWTDRDKAEELTKAASDRIGELQDRLYAQNRWGVLIILQGMDAAGKDSTIKHVLAGVNPQGCEVRSFKTPSAEELSHDWLWRTHKAVPERGKLGVFNRSYYEEVLFVRVHPETLARQKLPESCVSEKIWDERFEDINAFELFLVRNGYIVLKFFLNMSKEEQRERLLARLEELSKNWKFSPDDLAERARWDEYMNAYEQMIRGTSTKHAPWHVIPADRKWYARMIISAAIVQAMESLDLQFPALDPAKKKQIAIIEKSLRQD
jgi:PPK2 family polyphosphate:nucleotide phosphotransferase